MIDKKNVKWFIIGIAVLLIFFMKNTTVIPKEAVADIEGQQCGEDSDCPCLGKYNITQFDSGLSEEEATAWGIGVGSCEDNACNMTWCADLTDVGKFVEDKPWAWAKDNIVIVALIVGLLLIGLFMPK